MFGRTTRSIVPAPSGSGAELRTTPKPAANSTTTYVDESSEFSGTLKLAKDLHIDGTVEGEIECAQTVTIGPSGRVTASVCAEFVVIDGEIHGDIEARSEIALSKSARVYGDLMTEGIVIERGAKVEGRITIGPVARPTPRAAGATPVPESATPVRPPVG